VPLKPKAFLFDAYGTLFDVHSVVRCGGANLVGDLPALSQLWRQRQIEFTWLRALMERYEDFWHITEAALRSAVRELSIPATDEQIQRLMAAYLCPPVFADARSALEALKGSPLAILSNGSPKMLDAAVRGNGLESYFTEIISVDRVKTYKPSPRVYALGPQLLNVSVEEILFVSSNLWDAAGAKAFGYPVCWCDRSGTEMRASSSEARTGPARPSKQSRTLEASAEPGSVVRASSSEARTGPARPSKQSRTLEASAEPGSVVRASFSEEWGFAPDFTVLRLDQIAAVAR
jgi:2-haloacid dehalogenase